MQVPFPQPRPGDLGQTALQLAGTAPVNLTNRDIYNIAKVVQTEGGNRDVGIARGVIDTILNRVVSGRWGDSVDSVLNARGQFSAISGNRDAYGSVEAAPAPNRNMLAFTQQYIADRAAGLPSSVGGNLHFLNPNYSDPGPLQRWGNDVVRQGETSGQVFGRGDFVHYHGTAQGFEPVGDFAINVPFDLAEPRIGPIGPVETGSVIAGSDQVGLNRFLGGGVGVDIGAPASPNVPMPTPRPAVAEAPSVFRDFGFGAEPPRPPADIPQPSSSQPGSVFNDFDFGASPRNIQSGPARGVDFDRTMTAATPQEHRGNIGKLLDMIPPEVKREITAGRMTMEEGWRRTLDNMNPFVRSLVEPHVTPDVIKHFDQAIRAERYSGWPDTEPRPFGNEGAEQYGPSQSEFTPAGNLYGPDASEFTPAGDIYGPSQSDFVPSIFSDYDFGTSTQGSGLSTTPDIFTDFDFGTEYYGPSQSDFTPSSDFFGPSQSDFMPQRQLNMPWDFGPAQSEQYGPSQSDFQEFYGPSQQDFVPQTQTDIVRGGYEQYGPSQSDFVPSYQQPQYAIPPQYYDTPSYETGSSPTNTFLGDNTPVIPASSYYADNTPYVSTPIPNTMPDSGPYRVTEGSGQMINGQFFPQGTGPTGVMMYNGGTSAQPQGGDLRLGHWENGMFVYGEPAINTGTYSNTDRALGSTVRKTPVDLSYQKR